MYCSARAVSVEKALKKVSGVHSARVVFDQSEAVVSVDPDTVDNDALVKAVTEVGYKALVMK
jgi:Cu+-exporting ATPase